MRPLLLMVCVVPVLAGQAPATNSIPAAPQPLTNVARPPRAAEIEFVDFRFQEPQLYHLAVHYGPIQRQPSTGARYGVEAGIGGDDAIAWAEFHVVDEAGNRTDQVPMALAATGSGWEFVGLMTVPSHPFRILLTGESVDGTAFTPLHRRLFRPVSAPPAPAPQRPADLPPEMAAAFQQMFDELAPKTVAHREGLVTDNPGGRIVMPRLQVSNVMYAPLMSDAGRPLGLRMTYEVVFSHGGRFQAGLRVFAYDKDDFIVGRNALHPLRSAIEPRPREAHAPEQEAQEIPALLAQRTDFLYEGGTTYTFTLDLIPNFIVFDRDRVTRCVLHQRFRHDRDPSTAFARMLANQGPTTYRVSIGGRAFEGTIEGFYGEGTFYRSFVAEGVQDCDERLPGGGD